MMRSLFSAISGLKGHQTMMDVVGNNISNVNSTAFKASRITFQDIISQTLRGAQAPTATQGGLNPMQVGLGVQVGSVDSIMTQGNLQATGKPTDVAIQGDGFFQLTDGTNTFYTRDGNFTTDSTGRLIHSATGMGVVPAVTVPAGATNLTIAQSGQVSWTVGSTVTAGPIIQLANFTNPAGLTRTGNNLFLASDNSGTATPNNPGTNGLGSIQAGFLEMSNVDLAAQFTNMIIAQRGFQANSRVITASDEILQDLVNIKR
ncbi:MAG TPA: flagellar hook-basal body complex protein [Chloroflexota bacterium]|nr:flagellar hook-basal body complex protein [Chloroflexota bacterium]